MTTIKITNILQDAVQDSVWDAAQPATVGYMDIVRALERMVRIQYLGCNQSDIEEKNAALHEAENILKIFGISKPSTEISTSFADPSGSHTSLL